MKLKYKEPDNSFPYNLIDKEEALKRLGGNEKLYNKIIQDFYDRYRNIDIYSIDKKDLKVYIHNLSGLSGTIGAEKLESISRKAMNSLSEKDMNTLNKELEKILKNIEKLIL